MPFDGGGIDITLPAATDLSSYQYRFVAVDANGRATVDVANTTYPLGILQNKPKAIDQPARIRINGLSNFSFGTACNEGDLIAANSVGQGTPITAAGWAGAVVLLAPGGSGDIQEVMISRHKLA